MPLPRRLRILFAIYGNADAARDTLPHDHAFCPVEDRATGVLNWLIQDFSFLGLNGQNWMPLFGGALLLYVAVMIVVRRRETR